MRYLHTIFTPTLVSWVYVPIGTGIIVINVGSNEGCSEKIAVLKLMKGITVRKFCSM